MGVQKCKHRRRGWIKEVGSRAELRGTLVRAITIAIAYISLWYMHVPRSVLVYISMNVVHVWCVCLND